MEIRAKNEMTGNEIRETFLRFFESKGTGGCILPRWCRRTTHAAVYQRGMNQFKDLFLGQSGGNTRGDDFAEVRAGGRQA